jgi:hypothetical protein
MVISAQIAFSMSQHGSDETLPTFEEARTRFDDWLNDTALKNMSTEEYERRVVWGLSLNG